MKGMVVTRVGRLLSETLAWHHDAHRGLEAFHGSNLNRRSVGTHQEMPIALAEEGVMGVSSRVIARNVEGFEVVVVELYLGAIQHVVPH